MWRSLIIDLYKYRCTLLSSNMVYSAFRRGLYFTLTKYDKLNRLLFSRFPKKLFDNLGIDTIIQVLLYWNGAGETSLLKWKRNRSRVSTRSLVHPGSLIYTSFIVPQINVLFNKPFLEHSMFIQILSFNSFWNSAALDHLLNSKYSFWL